DPNQTEYEYTTGFPKIQPVSVRTNVWYKVTGYYFGSNYQDTPIEFFFMVDNYRNVTIDSNNTTGILPHIAPPEIIVNYYNGKAVIEILMPVKPKPRRAAIQIVDANGVGVPDYTFLLGNVNSGIIEDVFTTDAQGYTPIMTFDLNSIYYIGEVDISSYNYNIVGQSPYENFIPDWQNKIELYLKAEQCILKMGRESNFPTPNDISCYSGVCTFVYQEPQRTISKDIQIKKISTDEVLIEGAVFRVNNTTDYTTQNDGLTLPITITNGQSYVVQETSVPSGYLLDNREINITMNNTGTIEVSSEVDYDYDPVTRILSIVNQRDCPDISFMVLKKDAENGNPLYGAVIKKYKNNDRNKQLDRSLTDDYGRTHVMTMQCGETYYIKEAAVPPGYKSEHTAFAIVKTNQDASIEILDSSQLESWKKNGNTWIFTFVNYQKRDTPKPIPEPVEGCDPEYPYDNTINARNGFRQSSKEKLSKIVVFYKDSCVRSYTFCYGVDFYWRAKLESINQWSSEDTLGEYTHRFKYYNDAGSHNNLFKAPVTWNITDNSSDMDQNKRISKKLRNFFLNGFISPSVLGGSRTWTIGLNTGADIGLFPAFPLKTLSGGIYLNGSISTSKGKTTMLDINGDGLPDRVYNVMEGVKNRTYYCLQKPDRSGFETERKKLNGINIFLEDFSDNASIGLQASAVVHGGIQKGFLGNSWTSVYFADMNGDGFVDLVSPDGVRNIGKYQQPPQFSFPDSLPPEITTTIDSIEVRCDSNFSFTREIYERDRTEELRYDLVRVWQADMDCSLLPDLTYSICAPVHLAYDSIALENFCGLPDSVIVSIEYYGEGLTGTLEHILLWSDVIGDSDTSEHGPDYCDLNVNPGEEPDPEPDEQHCEIMLRKTDHLGNPLGNVIFKLEDGTELITDASNNGLTAAFYIDQLGDSVDVTEIITLPHCSGSQLPFTIYRGTDSNNCQITVQGQGSVSLELIGDRYVYVVTITNDCYEQAMCFARIRKIDQYGNPLEGVEFEIDNEIHGLSLTTDSLGLTSLINIFQGGCSRIIETTPLPHCELLLLPIFICADSNCNLLISPNDFPVTPEWINGMLVYTITIVNQCQYPCSVRLRKEDQFGNPLEGVAFRMNDGTWLSTDNQGQTSWFGIDKDDCAQIQEITTLQNCNPLPLSINICTDNNCNLLISPNNFTVTSEWINGRLFHTITIVNQCHYPCSVRLRKEDQYGNPLEGVEFRMEDGTWLSTDTLGLTSLINIFQGGCSQIIETTILPNCELLLLPIFICADSNCNLQVTPNYFPVTSEWINGMLVYTITIVNQCQYPCSVRLRKEDQFG
ncbi:MAG: hypothetical protein GX612_06730, partial [Bacteroidales bacterium]|nr:hypothetical protein [Bacteroidales bacterium]